jgi:hypothetical protein
MFGCKKGTRGSKCYINSNYKKNKKPVMVAIQTFLNNLEPSSDTKVKLIVQENNIYIQKAKPTIRVYVTDYSFITNYLIPFLDRLVFSSIKELDYLV